MRLSILILLSTAIFAFTGCGPTAALPLATPSAQPVVTVQVVATLAASPTAAAVLTPTTVPTSPSVTTTAGVVSYTSQALGIRFSYAPDQGGQKIGVQETGNKVFVYASNTSPTAGQWVQVFTKPATQSLEDAIRAQVLKGYSAQDCPVTKITNPNTGVTEPASYSYASIKIPQSSNEAQPTVQAKAGKCPQPYGAVGGLAYFVADAKHPDKFVFFSIGQYYILAGANQPWQSTIEFLNAVGVSAPGAVNTADYVDDRSNAKSLVTSFVSALNRKEYLRAYSYWEADLVASRLGPFSRFKQGYANTASVQLTLGTIGEDIGAGQIYSTVPLAMISKMATGATQTFVGCFTLHLGQPSAQGNPPFRPLGIQSAQVKLYANNANIADLLANACNATGIRSTSPAAPLQSYAADDISASRYMDDRTDAVQVLRSFFNAINRKEFVRAYSYWQPGTAAAQLPPFAQFQQGYANVKSVQLNTGQVRNDSGAGQLNFSVPAMVVAQNNDGTSQTFVACYTLHLSQPANQGVPPFQPMSITSAKNNLAANNANTADLLSQACK